jgi:hypothetical protein
MNYAFGVQFVELSPVHLSQQLENASAEEKEFSQVVKLTRRVTKVCMELLF